MGGLEKIITPELVEQALAQTGKQGKRNCRLRPDVMVWVMVAMGLFTDMPIRQVYKACRRLRKHEVSPARSSLCMARQRLGSAPLVALFHLVVRTLATSMTVGAFYRDMRKMGIDATMIEVPDCEAHQHFGRTSGNHGGGPFPQIRKVSLVELGTHVELAFVYGGCNEGERELAEKLWQYIPEDALLIEDRGLFSTKHWKLLHEKHKLLVRIQKSMVFRPFRQLEDGSFLAKLYPASWYREKDRRGIIVRVIEYKLDDPRRTGHDEVHRLMTNLLDAREFPASELIMEYHERWEEELVFDEQKTHQNPRRAEKTTHLRSETADGLKQELYALSLGHFIIRAMMLDAANEANIDVDHLSFKGSFQIIRTRLPECDTRSRASINQWYEAVIWEISRERIPPRRNRINPRVIKRKMSRWKKCRPHHRGRPPLTKTFNQTIVMLN
jgi:hypothetical protein